MVSFYAEKESAQRPGKTAVQKHEYEAGIEIRETKRLRMKGPRSTGKADLNKLRLRCF